MTNRHVHLSLAGLLILAAAQVPAQDAGKHAAEVQAIKDNEARWTREFELRDLEKTMAHYADDAVMMAPGFSACNGKDAIRLAIKQMLADPAMSLKFRTARVEVVASGEMASSQGTYTLTMTDPDTKKAVSSGGNYVTVYRKVAGEWKAVFDIASPAKEKER
jgi:uncharacterized protein (TIGR02246 family)